MANPQKEHGYTPISHELMGALLVYPFTAYEFKIVLCILKQTYGWRQKKMQMSYAEIQKQVLCSRRHIFNTCKKLQKENVIFIQKTVRQCSANIMGINKNYQSWERWPGGFSVDKSGQLLNSQATPIELSSDSAMELSSDSKRQTMELPSDSAIELSSDSPLYLYTENNVNNGINNRKQQTTRLKEISLLVKGLEICLKGADPRELVFKLTDQGFDMVKTWAAVIQSRKKKNPAGYFISIISNPKFAVSDNCFVKVKEEMKAWGI